MHPDDARAYADRFERMFSDMIRRGRRKPAFAGRLPRAQFVLLQILDVNGAMRAGELAKVLEVSPPAVSSLVGSLEQAGCVERAEAPDDRRVTLVSLSAHGRETLQRERAVHRARVIELLQHFAPAEIETFLGVMSRLHGLMSENEADGAGESEPEGS